MHSTHDFRGKCMCDARCVWRGILPQHCCCRAPLSKEDEQEGKGSEIAAENLCIASDCLLINLWAKSLKNSHDLHSPSVCMRLFNCSYSVEKDHFVHQLSGSPPSQAWREKGWWDLALAFWSSDDYLVGRKGAYLHLVACKRQEAHPWSQTEWSGCKGEVPIVEAAAQGAWWMLSCRRKTAITKVGFSNLEAGFLSPEADLLVETFGEQLVSAIAAPPCPWGWIALL